MANTNIYSWNKTLKFSWGHIIAFVALIFISYVTYMGDFYQNGGDFKSSAIKVFIIDIALIICFIGAQVYKGTDAKFDRSLIIERILILLCPVAFVLAMIPYNHFWSVFSERDKIEPKFSTAIEKSRQLFDNFNHYSNERITAYSNRLTNIIANKNINKSVYLQAGFTGINDDMVKENYVATLKLQLLSENTDSLCSSALSWINNASNGASVWNAFLIGNIDKISAAIEGWNQQLYAVSTPKLSNEGNGESQSVLPFDPNRDSFKAANDELKGLRELFVKSNNMSLFTLFSGIVLFIMLLFPYMLQKRDTKATGLYFLIPHRTSKIPEPYKSNDCDDNKLKNEKTNIYTSNDDIYSGTF